VSEPVIQRLGDDRIVVELAGVTDPGRAEAIVNRTAALEFVITDETNALATALPAMDRALAQLGVSAEPGATAGTSQVQDLITGAGRDSGQASADSAAAPAVDSTPAAGAVP